MANENEAEKFVENKHAVQNPGESSRRIFNDFKYFDLYIWYGEKTFKNIIGFQFCYRENPFDTDDEYYITQYPEEQNNNLVHQESANKVSNKMPASKFLEVTDREVPANFNKRYLSINESLPEEIKEFIDSKVKEAISRVPT